MVVAEKKKEEKKGRGRPKKDIVIVPKPKWMNVGGRPPLFDKEETIRDRINEYVDYCEKTEKPKTVGGLAFALGMDRATLNRYSKSDKFYHVIKRYKNLIEQEIEEMLITRKTSPIGLFFYLKNNFQWQDKSEVEHKLVGVDTFLSKLNNNNTPRQLIPDQAKVIKGEIEDVKK